MHVPSWKLDWLLLDCCPDGPSTHEAANPCLRREINRWWGCKVFHFSSGLPDRPSAPEYSMALRPYSYFVKELRASSRVLYSTMSPAIKLPGYGIPLNGFRAWRASPGDGFITNTEYDGSKDFRGRSFPNALDQSDIDYGSISWEFLLPSSLW